ncbi:50S ribosomal protein L16 [Candidatus Absconditicoccus praedator]|uniref:50S ribosomal protein L16 n=1 Tax=Candidatus Absconditicoccus praedator TaxID=2735562 RepID=UPI001E40B1A9|nr:50S ribosomal protein L16 [Candidatus Absconditicoccus praedator]UFX82782.1 50S ribosomal protein L16 [Candidatus Absconditicoccus praedator]
MSLLMPKKWKHRKVHRGRIKGASHRGDYVSFGDFGMKATSNNYLTNRQIEAARKVIVRYTRKVGKIWIRVFPDMPYTKKGLEMPMGKGKGDLEKYVVRVKRGRILFEINGVSRKVADEALKQASYKLPISTRVVEKGEVR